MDMKRKRIFKFLPLLLLVAGAVFVASCSSDDEEDGNVIAPTQVTDGAVTAFFDAELPPNSDHSKGFFHDQFSYNKIDGHKDVAFVIDGRQGLSDIYCGERELPAIDFDKYTLIVGQQLMPCYRFYITQMKLVSRDDGLHLVLYTRNDNQLLPCSVQCLFYWGLYPKLTQKLVSVDVYEEYENFSSHNRQESHTNIIGGIGYTP